MNIWKILGIHMTDDSSVIKSAYAGKLKGCHPEDDPEGFQRLREAFEAALKYAKARAKMAERAENQKDPEDPEDLYEQQEQEETDWTYIEEQRNSFPMSVYLASNEASSLRFSVQAETAELFRLMQVLYDDFYARINIENWKTILQTDLLWNMKVKEALRPTVLRFFTENPVLPQSVWLLMDTEFGWSNSSMWLPNDSEPDAVILLREIDPKWDLSFSQFHSNGNTMKEHGRDENFKREPYADEPVIAMQQENIPIWSRGRLDGDKSGYIDFALYAQYRRKLRDAIIDELDTETENLFNWAVKIFADDPDLYRIYFDYLDSAMPNGKVRPAKEIHLKIVNKVIEYFPDNHIYIVKKAELCLDRELYETAICEFLKLLVMYPDNLEITYNLAAAYNGAGMMKESKHYFKQLQKTYDQTQERLRLNKGSVAEKIAAKAQMEANERVFMRVKRIPKIAYTTYMYGATLLGIGIAFLLFIVLHFAK